MREDAETGRRPAPREASSERASERAGPETSGRAWFGSVAACVLASLLLTAGADRNAAPDPPRVLVVEPELLTKLKTLAAGLHAEVVLCLRGRVRGDTARATDFYMPAPRVSTSTRAVFDGCPGRALAAWHNHPAAGTASGRAGGDGWRPAGSGAARAPRDLCVLTRRDIETAARLRLPFVVVGVDERTWCWWTLDQVERMREGPRRPVPGQGEWAPDGVRATVGPGDGD